MATFVGQRSIATLNGSSKHKFVTKDISKSQVKPTTGTVWTKATTTNNDAPPALVTKQLVSFRNIVVRSVEADGASNAAFVEYEIEMANQKSGVVWTIRQRYSKFLELQHAIGVMLEFPHCPQCTELLEHVEELELPPKRWGLGRIWGAPENDTKVRARMFFVYLNALIELGSSKVYRQCPIVVEGFMKVVLAFLTPPSTPMELKPLKLQPKAVVVTKSCPSVPAKKLSQGNSGNPAAPTPFKGPRNSRPHGTAAKFTSLATIFEQEPISC